MYQTTMLQNIVPSDMNNSTAQAVREVWSTLLGVDAVDDGHNFFELGGNSLLASIAIGALSDLFDLTLNVSALYENPTVPQLVTHILDSR